MQRIFLYFNGSQQSGVDLSSMFFDEDFTRPWWPLMVEFEGILSRFGLRITHIITFIVDISLLCDVDYLQQLHKIQCNAVGIIFDSAVIFHT